MNLVKWPFFPFVLIISLRTCSKGMEVLLLAFFIVPTDLTVIEHHISELLSDFGVSC